LLRRRAGAAATERKALRAGIEDLRASRKALTGEIERRFPDYARLVNPAPPTPQTMARSLAAGEAVLATYFTPRRALVFLLRRDGGLKMAAGALTRKALRRRVAGLRRALDPAAQTLGGIPDFDLAAAHSLYRDLFAGFADDLAGVRHLFVVPHDDLAQIPLGVLTTEPHTLAADREVLFERYRRVPWLARRLAVSVLPSDAALIALRAVAPWGGARRELAAFGDPLFNTAQAGTVAAGTATGAATMRGIESSRQLVLRRRAAPAAADSQSADIGVLPRLPDTLDEGARSPPRSAPT